MVSGITRLNDYKVLIGRAKSRDKRKGELVFSNWTERFVAILVRKVSSPHIKKVENAWKWVSGWVVTGGEKIF